MSVQSILGSRSVLTGLAACLFAAGIVTLFVALFRDAAHGGPWLWIAIVLLLATMVCWFAAARAEDSD